MYLHSTLCMSPYACMKQCSTLMHFCMKHIHLCMAHIHLCTYMPKHYVSTLCIMSKHKIYIRHKCMSIKHKCLITKHKCSTSVHNVAVSYIFLALIKCLLIFRQVQPLNYYIPKKYQAGTLCPPPRVSSRVKF